MRLDIPKHVAIVMDGNGRWAQRRGHPRVFGHIRGSARVEAVVREADQLGIEALTLYAFSTENWLRPEAERKVLWKLLKKYLFRNAEKLHRQNVRLYVIGELERLDADVRAVLDPVLEKLSGNTGLKLTFAISYGSRAELSRAARLFSEDCVAGRRLPSQMNEHVLESYLWTSQFEQGGAIDLFIRTGGERRVSNFLLWQSAYAEFIFMDVSWPEFEPKHLKAAVLEYSTRERRFGRTEVRSGELSHV